MNPFAVIPDAAQRRSGIQMQTLILILFLDSGFAHFMRAPE